MVYTNSLKYPLKEVDWMKQLHSLEIDEAVEAREVNSVTSPSSFGVLEGEWLDGPELTTHVSSESEAGDRKGKGKGIR